MADWLGPDDAWPEHPNPAWRDALGKARGRGWYFHEFNSHSFGRVSCLPPGADVGCTMLVFSSGRSTDRVAGELVKMVRRCPHHNPDDLEPLLKAEEKLRGATILVAAAEAQLERDEKRQRANQILDMLIDIDAAMRKFDEALRLEQEATQNDDALRSAAEQHDLPTDPLPTTGEFIDEAEQELNAAERHLRGARKGAQLRQLRDQARALRSRIKQIRRRLGDS